MFHRKNLILIGLSLLVVFAAAIWLLGVQIDATTSRVHRSMVKEIGEYRSEMVRQDFKKTEELGQSVQDFLKQNGYDKEKLIQFLTGLIKLDHKVSRGWFRRGNEYVICGDTCIAGVLPDSVPYFEGSTLYRDRDVLYWTLCGRYGEVAYGFDISLIGLHDYFADLVMARQNYLYILNDQGVVIAYPDEKWIGVQVKDRQEIDRMEQTIREGKVLETSGFSRFLSLPVEKVYYPIGIGSEKWVVVVNVLKLENQEAMADFHRYALGIAVITVIIFSILLAVSQYKWRKEYDLRRKVEQEALQLNIQQLRNQLNPHFLFNTLNSLSALIGTDPSLAKEFVLNLSKVYRYVLDKRNENLGTVKEEIEFTCHYYFLQRIRFGEQLVLDMKDGLEETEGCIPAMSLQILIENAIKHNEITRLHPLYICIYHQDDFLIVENSYRPRSDESDDSMGIGLENIRKIYEFFSKRQFKTYVEGEKFICKLPLLNN